MDLFIRIVDGKPIDHPIFGDNFREAFPHIDVDNLPPEFARFERVPYTEPVGILEVAECSYDWVNGVVKDVWTVRPMTSEEETQRKQELTNTALETVEFLKQSANEHVANAKSLEEKQAWEDYATALNNWTLVDPLLPHIPKPPRVSSDGSLVTVNSAGATPDVIG